MDEIVPPIRLTTFRGAEQHARGKLREVAEGMEVLSLPTVTVPQELFDYFFELQLELENEGPMDYHEYARRMWRQFMGEAQGTEGFNQFEKMMIVGLHTIDMSDVVYPGLLENMPELIAKYKDSVELVAIWSTGDVSATGYQPGKIGKSGIIKHFFALLPREGRYEFVKDRTAYMVDDNKFERLAEYCQQVLERDSSKPVKIVIIEDLVGNFDKARKAVDERLGSQAVNVEIVRIWFTGSREGMKAPREFVEEARERLNAIATFDELLNLDRFGEIFEGAHVFVDFDGVIGDNIEMRKRQARVIFGALVSGIRLQTGEDVKQLLKC